MNPNRGSFPKSTTPETPEAKRLRFEEWMIATAAGDIPDPELAAILAQPNHDTAVVNYSLERIVRARCWQCVAGNEDEGARERIEQCGVTTCSLHPVRPYRPGPEAAGARLYRRQRCVQHCRDCQGGSKGGPLVARAITACPVVSCAIWPVRPILSQSAPDGEARELESAR